MFPIPKIIGHRGAAGVAPENTLGGFRKAAELGITWIELDVTLLGDGTAVVNHDKSIDRCSNQTALLQSLKRDDLDRINNAALFSDWPHEPLPLLSEVLSLFQTLKLGMNLEIKDHGVSIEKLVNAIQTDIQNTGFNKTNPLIVSSFNHDVLVECKKHCPDWSLGVLFDDIPDDWLDRAKEVNAVTVHCNWKKLSYAQTQSIKDNNYPLLCWTANEPDLVEPLWAWGIDAVISDMPHLFIQHKT